MRLAVTATRSAVRRRPTVLLWGPFPHQGGVFGGGIGGYARCNSQMLRSRLSRAVTLRRLPMTVPRFHNRILARLHLVPRLLTDCASLLWGLLRHRPDVLHITALYWRSIYREACAVALCRLLGVPVIYDLRAGTFIEFVESRGVIGRALIRTIMALATEVTVEGLKYVDYVESEFGRSPTWIPNFVLEADLSAFAPARLRRPEQGEPFRIAFTGYLIPDKGVDVLMRAAERLSRRCPVELTLIGERSERIGEELERFRALQSESFRLLTPGRLELNEVLSTLQQQHVFVFLSRFHGEGHSNAVSEAMAMGLPVVVSRHGFLADVVTADCGVVVSDPLDVDAVVEELWRLRSDWELLRSLGMGARERIRIEFGEGPVLGRTEELYRRCAARAA